LANYLAERLLSIHAIRKIYDSIPDSDDPTSFPRSVVQRFQISHSIQPHDLSAIPAKGPTIVIANHPFGGVDGIVLSSILCTVRKDVRILANHFLGKIPKMRPLLFMVDPFGTKSSIRKNGTTLKEAVRWVKNGGMLMVFPAGEVSHFRWQTKKLEDPKWEKTVARLVRWTQAKVVPVYFKGGNSMVFQLAGLIHPVLRTLLLPREMVKKQSTHITLKIGTAIPYKRIAAISDDADLVSYLRFRTYLLGNAFNPTPGFLNTPERKRPRHKRLKPIVPPIPRHDLIREIETLPEDQCLITKGALKVYVARGSQAPKILEEIGRLREVTFRKVGEGTGKPIDLDRFDQHYRHLFVWNDETAEVVGAYRLAATDEVVKTLGKEGLYTHTLFQYQTRLLFQISPALEMSRSFVRREYQKSYTPLLLLWKGIGRFVVRYPRYKILFGAVSITNEYSSYSRQLMASFLRNSQFLDELSEMVRPRKPFRQKCIPELKGEKTAGWPEDIEELSAWISDIETDKKGVPILLKQYLKLGGKLLSFNIDPSFGNVLDGLIMVDLTATDPKLLQRYMKPKGYADFMAFQQRQYAEPSPAFQIPATV
jgi:putative hemolysin